MKKVNISARNRESLAKDALHFDGLCLRNVLEVEGAMSVHLVKADKLTLSRSATALITVIQRSDSCLLQRDLFFCPVIKSFVISEIETVQAN